MKTSIMKTTMIEANSKCVRITLLRSCFIPGRKKGMVFTNAALDSFAGIRRVSRKMSAYLISWC